MRVQALLAALSCAAVVAADTVTSAPVCQVAPPRTVSPTNSRLWTVDHRGVFVATPEYVNADGSL
jgi:hypothetical protein